MRMRRGKSPTAESRMQDLEIIELQSRVENAITRRQISWTVPCVGRYKHTTRGRAIQSAEKCMNHHRPILRATESVICRHCGSKERSLAVQPVWGDRRLVFADPH